MSLINDALKRANQAQKRQTPNAPATPAPVHAPLQPVEAPPRSGSVPWTAIIIVTGLLLGAGTWFIVTAKHTYSEPAPEPVAVASAPVQIPMVAPASVPPPTPISAAPAPAAVVAPPKPAPVAVPPVAVAPAPPIVVASVPVAPPPKPAPVMAPAQPEPVAAPVEAQPVAPVAPPQMPTLKLQGIFYRLTKSSAMINGRVLYVGESIDGVKVVRIERQHVVVDFHGERKVLDF